MNKTELIAQVAEKTNLKKSQVQEVVDAIFNAEDGAIATVLRSGDKLSLPGFGSFKRSSRAARTGRNPQTGKEINIPASNSASFSAGKSLKDALNQ